MYSTSQFDMSGVKFNSEYIIEDNKEIYSSNLNINKGNYKSFDVPEINIKKLDTDENLLIVNYGFEVKPVIEYVFADATNANNLNQTYSSDISSYMYVINKK